MVDAANRRHAEAHDQGGDSNDGGASYENAAVDAMELGITGADARAELEWTENHEEKAGNDVNESEDGIMGEEIVEWDELCGDGIGWGRHRLITVKDHGKKNDSSAGGDGDTDKR